LQAKKKKGHIKGKEGLKRISFNKNRDSTKQRDFVQDRKKGKRMSGKMGGGG